MALTHKTRLETTLAGDPPDRVPVALWRHFPVDDQTAKGIAESHLNFQNNYDFDLVKVTPASGYFLYDWGVKDEWRGSDEGTRVYTHRAVHTPQDWAKLPILDPRRGHLAEQLSALKEITTTLGPDTPVIFTIFNPLSQAKKLVGDENLFTHIEQHTQEFKQGLEIIVESTRRFIREAVGLGIAGIFFAVQHARPEMMTTEQYNEFGRTYDLPVLEEAADLWLNILHLHGDGVRFDELADYPVSVINWHDLDTPPDLAGGKEKFSGAVCGGLRQWGTMVLGTPEQVQKEAQAAIEKTGGTRFILGTGCVTPITAPHGNILAARRSVG